MDVSSINSDLIRGNVTTIILKALMTEDRYGYDILREIEVKSGGQYKLKQPTLYSCLKRLEKQGLISSYWGDENETEGGRRRYYSLTDAGRNYLNKMQSEYEYSRTILDSLLSEDKFDFDSKEAPFDINSLRPYTKRSSEDDEQSIHNQSNQTAYVQSINGNINAVNNFDRINKSSSTENKSPINDVPKPENNSMFEPLDRGQGSYDEGYRHTSRSVFDMLNEINSIIDKKNDNSNEEEHSNFEKQTSNDEQINELYEQKELLIDKKSEAEKPLISDNQKTVDETQNNDVIKTMEIDDSIKQNLPEESVNALSEEEILKRENARRTLGIGEFKEDTVLNLSKFDNQKDKFENTEKSVSPTNEEINNQQTAQIDELKFSLLKPKEDLIEPELEDKELARSTAHEILFGNRDNKSQDENFESSQPKEFLEPLFIFDKYNKKEETFIEPEKEIKKVNIEPSPVPPASSFSFRNDEKSVVNYRDAFSSLRNINSDNVEEENLAEIDQKPASSIDLKTKLFSQGYKLRPYTRENTENYYSLNYLKKNRINRDCYALMYLIICAEVFIGWLIFRDKFSSIAYAAICICALLVPAIPFVAWSMNPDKRVRANYNFRTSILNRLMLYLNLLVLVCLVGFFAFGANINNAQSMLAPIFIPAILLLNIPLSSIVYLLLYKTNKYHVS